jgi:hypothetical protein
MSSSGMSLNAGILILKTALKLWTVWLSVILLVAMSGGSMPMASYTRKIRRQP